MSYTEFVISRFKDGASTIQDISASPPNHIEILHAAIGMIGEWVEIINATDRTNLEEELGDFLFYHTAGIVAIGAYYVEDAFQQDPETFPKAFNETDMLMNLGDFLDHAKKLSIYAKPLDTDALYTLRFLLYSIARRFHAYANTLGFTVEGLRRTNEAKLTKRYPTSYSNSAAQERADKK